MLAEEAKVMDTVVFAGPPVTEQTMWPAHCIQNTWGAEQHQELKVEITELKLIWLLYPA